MQTKCLALYLIDLPTWIFCTVGILKVLLEGNLRYYPHIFFWHIKTYGDNIYIHTTGLEMDVVVSCAETGDSCHSFNICLFVWWKLLSTNIQRNESILEEISRYRFQLHFFSPLTYGLTFYLIKRPSYFARNAEFWLSYPVYSSGDSEKWNLCEKSHLCLRIAVSSYLKVGPFRHIRAPVVLTPVPIRERSCLRVEKRQNYVYPLDGVAAVRRK